VKHKTQGGLEEDQNEVSFVKHAKRRGVLKRSESRRKSRNFGNGKCSTAAFVRRRRPGVQERRVRWEFAGLLF
jgi:hypothetical protein